MRVGDNKTALHAAGRAYHALQTRRGTRATGALRRPRKRYRIPALCGCSREPWKNFRSHPICALYKPIRKLGSGAFSEVWQARELATGSHVALKVVFWDNPSLRSHHRRVLRKEVDVLRTLRHDHIIAFREHLEDAHHLIVVLELLRGGGLTERLFDAERLPEPEAAQLFAQLLAAVEYMHARGVMHRDIKPENVVFEARGGEAEGPPRLKLVDFGLAREYSSARSVKARLGSPGFMAPETIMGERHTPAMDMFSLGVILFVMLTGHKPMRSEQARSLAYAALQAHEYPRMASSSWRRRSEGARSLVLRLLERDPLKRITAKQAARHEWVVTGGGGEAPARPAEAARKRVSRERRFRGLARALNTRPAAVAMMPCNTDVIQSVSRDLLHEESHARDSHAPGTRSCPASARASAVRSAHSTEAPLEGTGRNEEGHVMLAVAEEDAAHFTQCENVLTIQCSPSGRSGGMVEAALDAAAPPALTAPLAALSGRRRSTVATA